MRPRSRALWQNSHEEKREPHHFMSFFEELKRRNVFRVGAAYAVTAWVLLQVLDVVGEILELPAWGGKLILLVLVATWAMRLSIHLSLRNAHKSEDHRYAAMRERNPRFAKHSLVTVFGLQAVLAWLISSFDSCEDKKQQSRSPFPGPRRALFGFVGRFCQQESQRPLAIVCFR